MVEHRISLDNERSGHKSGDDWSLNTPLLLCGDLNSEPDSSLLHLIYDKKYLLSPASGRTDPKKGHPCYKHISNISLL